MGNVSLRGRRCLLGIVLLAVTPATMAHASVIQSTVILPPLAGMYSLGGTCVSALARCTQNGRVSDFEIVDSLVSGGDQFVDVTATYSADIYTEVGGLPGALLGHLSIPGTAQFKYVGRDPFVNPLGTFATELTAFSFSGALNGNTFEVKRNTAATSAGSTTILPVSLQPPITYEVTSAIEILALYSFNGSPFAPAPPRTGELAPAPDAVPEPATSLLAAGALLAAAARRRYRRSRIAA